MRPQYEQDLYQRLESRLLSGNVIDV